ncbi:hypothetical protein [Zhihengliuella halotolerans]|uniref:hypothetical protein n=1 Tax=Zhihengliuella halotolerans TaxID=370736 RepID=UPI0011AFB835|nr:hypothetical protein [Zhihengliuella halotolerans]
MELFFCPEHTQRIASGTPWLLDKTTGAVLLDAAVPPSVIVVSGIASIGNLNGVLLHMTTTRNCEVSKLELLLPSEKATMLRDLLDRHLSVR